MHETDSKALSTSRQCHNQLYYVYKAFYKIKMTTFRSSIPQHTEFSVVKLLLVHLKYCLRIESMTKVWWGKNNFAKIFGRCWNSRMFASEFCSCVKETSVEGISLIHSLCLVHIIRSCLGCWCACRIWGIEMSLKLPSAFLLENIVSNFVVVH